MDKTHIGIIYISQRFNLPPNPCTIMRTEESASPFFTSGQVFGNLELHLSRIAHVSVVFDRVWELG